ncbi:MAG: HEAT repeat domain-containing protein [Lutibacter sp.]|jgi:hypothetical protein
MEIYQYVIDYFENAPTIIKVVWISSSIFFITIIFLIIYLKFLRYYLRKNEKIVAQLKIEYESQLITYLYAGNEEEEISVEQQEIINKLKIGVANKFKRQLIVSTLVRLRNEISGEMAEAIQKLYFQTGIISYALSSLKSKKWYVVAKGIRELKLFHVKQAYNKIVIHVNHPKREVRIESQLYLVTLFHFDGLKFLDVLQTPLSEWDQIQLLEVLQKFDDQEIPDINPWLKSTNDFVVIFALKLAKIYNQFEAKEALIELLNHTNKKIRIGAIHVLSELQVVEAKSILKNNFETLSIEEQIAFFKLLENSFESSDESFLLKQVTHKNFEIKLAALKILKIIDIEKFVGLKEESTEPEYLKIYKFVENN